MSVLRETIDLLVELDVLDERLTEPDGREHEYEPDEFGKAALDIGSYRWNNGKVRKDADDAELGKHIDTLSAATKSMQGSGNYIDAAGVIDKLKKDKRFSSSFKRLGKGLPDDKRSDKKPPSPNMYPQSSKPIAANVPETPEAETYDKADVKKVSDWLNNQFPGKWPFRGQDLRQPLKAGLAAGPGTPEWRHAGKAVDDTKGAFSDAPRVQRKRVEPPRPGGKLGALLKQADAARDDKERGAKKGEVRHWKSGDYQKQDDGSWKHLPGKGKNGG